MATPYRMYTGFSPYPSLWWLEETVGGGAYNHNIVCDIPTWPDGQPGTVRNQSIKYDWVSETWYVLSPMKDLGSGDYRQKLLTLDPVPRPDDGILTDVGNIWSGNYSPAGPPYTGWPPQISCIAINSSGDMYGLCNDGTFKTRLVSIDKATPSMTTVWDTGVSSFAQFTGLAFDANDRLWAQSWYENLAVNPDVHETRLYRFDTDLLGWTLEWTYRQDDDLEIGYCDGDIDVSDQTYWGISAQTPAESFTGVIRLGLDSSYSDPNGNWDFGGAIAFGPDPAGGPDPPTPTRQQIYRRWPT